MKIVAIANQKGGVGKTTTAVNLSACLAELGVPVLLIDLDPQANATSGVGLPQEEGASLYGSLIGRDTTLGKIRETGRPNFSMIPSHEELAGCEVELAQAGDHLMRMRQVLAVLRKSSSYQYVILDCPPSLGILMTSALAAADELLVPLQCEFFGLEGLSKIVGVAEQIRQCGANPDLKLEGIVMTMFDSRITLANQVVAEVREYFTDAVYQSVIPRTVRLGEAPSFGKTITEYDTNGRGAVGYRQLAEEFLKRRGGALSQVPVSEERKSW